jgi:glycosyltransferase EpsF
MRPVKVIHIVESLNRGAVENWLIRMLRFAIGRGFPLDWTFYCALGNSGQLEGEALRLGARVIHSPAALQNKMGFLKALRHELRRGGYEVLHCHHDVLSGAYLLASIGLPIRKRIVQVHNADAAVPTPSPLKQRLYREPMRRICLSMSDRIVGISNHTLDTFLAGRPRRPGCDVVHYYGVDTMPFENEGLDRANFHRQLGIAREARILLFAGRLVPEKNPVFAVDVLAELKQIEPRAVAVFAGSGSQGQVIAARAWELGVNESIRLLGWRSDLPSVMRCCDWFILPRPEHPKEGFGLAVVEAQLAGLRLLLSNGIAADPLLPTASFRQLPLSAGPNVWAHAAEELLRGPPPQPAEALIALKHSPMNMDTSLKHLLQIFGT